MDFKEKNNFIVKHTSEEHFEADKKLFIEKCKPSQLHNDLARVNRFNRKQFDGRIITAMLNAGVSPEEVLANRKGGEKPTSTKVEAPKAAAEVSQKKTQEQAPKQPQPAAPKSQKRRKK